MWIAGTIVFATADARPVRADTTVDACPWCSQAPLSLPAQVGEKIFADRSPSASGQLACANLPRPGARVQRA
jgi:hypothetical protein